MDIKVDKSTKSKVNWPDSSNWNWEKTGDNKITPTNIDQEPVNTGKKQTTSGNISISSSSPNSTLEVDGTIQVDPEQHKKKKAASKKQREKLEKLKDHMIDFLSEHNIGHSRRKRWKSDLETIQEKKEKLQSSLENYANIVNFTGGGVNLLDASEMKTLNEIYERWS